VLNRLRAIVFDFDGVIADSEPLHLRAFQQTLAEEGIGLGRDEYYNRYLGFDDGDVFRAIGAARGWTLDERTVDALAARKAERYQALVAGVPVVFPAAARRIVEWAAQVPLAIASGALRSEIEAIVRTGGLAACFAVIVAAGETPRGKPAPDPYLRALELLNAEGSRGGGAAPAIEIAPSRVVVIEDSRWGIESAHAAGMPVVALTTSYPAPELAAADLVAASLDDLTLDTLDALCG